MALWHFLKDGAPVDTPAYHDGLHALPGEADFTREAADAQAKALGDGVVADYLGCPMRYEAQAAVNQAAADALAAEQAAQVAADLAASEASEAASEGAPAPAQE